MIAATAGGIKILRRKSEKDFKGSPPEGGHDTKAGSGASWNNN